MFEKRLRRMLPPNWSYIEDLDVGTKADLDENYRFWFELPYTAFVRNRKFSMQRFREAILDKTAEAIALKPGIDRILRAIE